MILGLVITPAVLMVGGTVLLLLVTFQFLQGRRIIHFKGPLHMKVHKACAWALLALAIVHGLLGFVFGLGLTIG